MLDDQLSVCRFDQDAVDDRVRMEPGVVESFFYLYALDAVFLAKLDHRRELQVDSARRVLAVVKLSPRRNKKFTEIYFYQKY